MRARRHLWWFRAWWSKNPLLRPPTKAQRLSTAGAALLCLVLALSVPAAAAATWNATSAAITDPKGTHTVQATETTPRDSADLARASMRIPSAPTAQWSRNGELLSSHGRTGIGTAVALAVLATMATAATALGLAFAALRLRGRWLLRHHARAWDREWQQVQPLWTGRGYAA